MPALAPFRYPLLLIAALLAGPVLAQDFRCPLFGSGFEPGGAAAGGPACTARLNDSGITHCMNAAGQVVDCPHVLLPGQDGETGRDAVAELDGLPKRGFGPAGYDFSKLDANGNELPVRAIRWSCLRDNRSGLIWEVKVNDVTSPSHAHHRFTWYHPSAGENGGPLGSEGVFDRCQNSLGGRRCNTHAMAQTLNSEQRCGRSDWRLPRLAELIGLVDFASYPPRAIPGVFDFVSSLRGYDYWTRDVIPTFRHAHVVSFSADLRSEHLLDEHARVLMVAGRP